MGLKRYHGDFIFSGPDFDLPKLKVVLIIVFSGFARCMDPINVVFGGPCLGDMLVSEANKIGFGSQNPKDFSGISHFKPQSMIKRMMVKVDHNFFSKNDLWVN